MTQGQAFRRSGWIGASRRTTARAIASWSTRWPSTSTAGAHHGRDLGCGTAPTCAPPRRCWADSHWTLVDYEQALLDAAAERLAAWADGAELKDGNARAVSRAPKRINVEFPAPICPRPGGRAGRQPNLVTASALFDLASAPFIATSAAAIAARKSAFYTVLTYDGDQRWTPEHEADAALTEAFHAHQRRDKASVRAGPDAPDALSEAFASAATPCPRATAHGALARATNPCGELATARDAVRETGQGRCRPPSRRGAPSPAPPP